MFYTRYSPVREVAYTMDNTLLQQDIPVLMVPNNTKNSTYLTQQNQNLNQATNSYNISQLNQIKTLSTNLYDLSQS